MKTNLRVEGVTTCTIVNPDTGKPPTKPEWLESQVRRGRLFVQKMAELHGPDHEFTVRAERGLNELLLTQGKSKRANT